MPSKVELIQGDCLEVMRGMPDNSVDLILTDPPYYRVKGEWWDRQWDTVQGFIGWIGLLCEQWERILKPNGSLYVFASPKMSARVEVEIGRRFNVLNTIRWVKSAGWHNKTEKESLRAYLSPYESIIFAEHYGADNIAKGEAGYEAKCDELRGFVFEPIRAYLAGEIERAGVPLEKMPEILGYKSGEWIVQHYINKIQFRFPTEEHYHKMRDGLQRLNHGGEYLRREYEDLRREYEDLRRPFSVTADVPYTDVWDFQTVQAYPGKHPCEKPAALLEHVITSSTRPGAVVLDCFAGSGSTLQAAKKLGRDAIGIEIDPGYFAIAQKRIAAAQQQPLLEGI